MFLQDYQEITAEILKCAQVKEYLQYLQQCELINFDEEKRTYITTMKGKRFVELYNEMTDLALTRRDKLEDS